ncbi:helix-turn-helix transcriptional regulator [Mucilaginibacter sp. Bleaf8]|uniref:helix-turn-helix domain-containing protein n=1 Tax=Mucilaginibacter sp. Bleaf8 TaxID=2834430 RepID=UPI001BCB1DC7|nr:helix-turn-helix transcriptional regulator [Mucilaginibacter sp. Bleaf8]MBS7566023.1 helix-turn-helix transcriptional regulator [Mucilaginibacter sp. Bleaf8]
MLKDVLEAKVKAVAINIRKVREYRNYTQEYLAMKLDISQNAYSKIELGYTKITLERVFQIASILDVDMVDLLQNDHIHLLKALDTTQQVAS